jgi:hypothetical protein
VVSLEVLDVLRLSFPLWDSPRRIWLLVSGGSQIADWLVSLRKDEVVRCREFFCIFGLRSRGSDESWIRCELARMPVAASGKSKVHLVHLIAAYSYLQ